MLSGAAVSYRTTRAPENMSEGSDGKRQLGRIQLQRRSRSFEEHVARATTPEGVLARDEPIEESPAAAQLQAALEAYARGEMEAAVAMLQKGIGIDPRWPRLHYHLGLLYGEQENVSAAVQALERAAELEPHDFSTLKSLALLYQRMGLRVEASEMWQRALGVAPDEDTRASIRSQLVSLS